MDDKQGRKLIKAAIKQVEELAFTVAKIDQFIGLVPQGQRSLMSIKAQLEALKALKYGPDEKDTE